MPMKPLENREGSGVFFARDVEEGSKRPNYTGGFRLNGEEWELSGWIRQSKNGREYISLSVRKPRDNGGWQG